ncbi:MAG: Crp/Fnr family transcriptional regulator [Bacteroidota bacterium]|jgi:CRP-like cAMP-binding protein|nr:Crp/Fnr family transcriptional regulator [Bacteroidota bacterium]
MFNSINFAAMPSSFGFPVDKFHFRSDSVIPGLPKTELKFLESKMVTNKFKKGKTVFSEGSYPSGVFYLLKGKIKKYKSNNNGKEQIITICGDGEILGYPALLSGEAFPDSAITLEDSLVAFIPKDDFMKLLNESPILCNRLLKSLSHKFSVMENIIVAFAHKTVRERLALSLLILIEKFREKGKDSKKTEIILSREDLANFVGTAVETLVRLIKEFKDEGYIETEGKKIRVLNLKEMVRMANVY